MKLQAPEDAEVRVYHYRPAEGMWPGRYWTRFEHKTRGTKPASKGGWTRVVITLADGTEVWGESRCSKLDNFCRATGRNIALGRALKQLEVTP